MFYIYITTFIYTIFISLAKKGSIINNKYSNNTLAFLLIIIVSVSIYHVDIQSVPDMRNYLAHFESLRPMKFNELIGYIQLNNEPLFDIFQWVVVKSTGSFKLFVVLVWVIISSNIIHSIRKIFPESLVLFVFVSFLSFFLFFDYVINVMRQGLSLSFLFLALTSLINNDKNKMFYIQIAIAPLLHLTSLPLSLALFLLRFINIGYRMVMFGWLISAILFLTGFNYKLFSPINIDLIETYTSSRIVQNYGLINRLDFFIFSAFFAIIGIILYKYILNKKDDSYKTLLNLYLIFNSYFLCFGFIAYNDRIAAYSWMLIPMLIWKVIPNAENERFKTFALISVFLISAIFTGSMNVIINSL